MKPENYNERKKVQLKFAAFYALSFILIILILSSFWGPLPSATIKGRKTALTGNLSQEHKVLMADEMLHQQLNRLQQLDQKYNTLLTDSATAPGMKTIIQTITEAEAAFSKTIDSINESGKNYSQENMYKFENMTASFRTLLNNRAYAEHGRNITPNVNKNSGIDQNEMTSLKKALEAKESQIANLERQLKSSQTGKYSYPISPVDKLRQENDFLKLALRSQVVQTNTLKESNEQLTNQLNKFLGPNTPKRPN